MKYAITPAAKRAAAERGIDLAKLVPTGVTGYIQLSDVLSMHSDALRLSLESKKATGLAKAIAAKHNIDLSLISAEGTIRKADVLQYMQGLSRGKTIPHSAMRKVIARRMAQSMREVPQYTLFSEVEVGELCALMEAYAAKMLEVNDVKPTYSDLFIKAAALALAKHERLNSSFFDDRIEIHSSINVGLAVALGDGLIVPNIKDADRLPLIEVTRERKRLVELARGGKLPPQEYAGGTFTITNLGQYPVRFSTPIINQPESAILGIGAIEKKVVPVENDAIAIRPVVGISLTLDHRHIDGAAGAAFLAELKRLLQNPNELTNGAL